MNVDLNLSTTNQFASPIRLAMYGKSNCCFFLSIVLARPIMQRTSEFVALLSLSLDTKHTTAGMAEPTQQLVSKAIPRVRNAYSTVASV